MKKLENTLLKLVPFAPLLLLFFVMLAWVVSTPADEPVHSSVASPLSHEIIPSQPLPPTPTYNPKPRPLPKRVHIAKPVHQPAPSHLQKSGTSFFGVVYSLLKTTLEYALVIVVVLFLCGFLTPEGTITIPDYASSVPDELSPNRVCYDTIPHPHYQKRNGSVMLPIPNDIGYGKQGNKSLAKLDNTIRNLVKDPSHKQLFLFLDFERVGATSLPRLGVPMTLLNALSFYKSKKKNHYIVAYAPCFELKSYLIASHADHICTEEGTPLYLPWCFIHKTLDEMIGTGIQSDKLNERNLSQELIITYDEDRLIVGQHKTKCAKEDIIAIHKKTLLAVFSKSVKTRKIKTFSFGKMTLIVSNLRQLVFGYKNVFDPYYKINYDKARSLNLIDEPKYENLSDVYVSLKKIKDRFFPLIPKPLPLCEKPSIDVVYIKGEFKYMEEARNFARLFGWLAKKDFVKGVVLLIDSPGGLMAYVETFAAALDSLRKTKPLVAYTQKDCCSAAYLVASYGHCIVAQQTARVGSIGVILPSNCIFSLLLTEQEQKNHVKKVANDFIETVANNRHQQVSQPFERYKKSLIKTQARIFPAVTAKEKGLVDYIGDLYAAIRILRQLITNQNVIKGKRCKVFYHEPL